MPAHPPHVSGPAIRGRADVGRSRRRRGDGRGHWWSCAATRWLAGPSRRPRPSGLGCFDVVGCTAPTSEGRVAQDGRFEVAVPKGQTEQDDLSLTILGQHGIDRTGGHHGDASLCRPPRGRRRDHSTGRQRRLADQRQPASPTTSPAPVLGASGIPAVTHVQSGRASAARQNSSWSQSPAQDVSSGYDPRVVEDGRGLARRHGRWVRRDGSRRLHVELAGRAARSIPPSRGAPCVGRGQRGPADRTASLRIDQRDARHRVDPSTTTRSVVRAPAPAPPEPRARRDGRPGPSDPGDAHSGPGMRLHLPGRVEHRRRHLRIVAPGSPGRRHRESSSPLPSLVRSVTAVRVQTATGGFFSSLRQVSVSDESVQHPSVPCGASPIS